jgi:hypothetical protein
MKVVYPREFSGGNAWKWLWILEIGVTKAAQIESAFFAFANQMCPFVVPSLNQRNKESPVKTRVLSHRRRG